MILLTKRQLQIAHLIGKCYSYQQIANELFISLQTVRSHMWVIAKKTKACTYGNPSSRIAILAATGQLGLQPRTRTKKDTND